MSFLKLLLNLFSATLKVELSIKQGNPNSIAQMVTSSEADFAITTETLDEHIELRKLPCGEWTHAIVVPHDHPLLDFRHPISITDIAQFPLVTYEFAFNSIARSFRKAKIEQPKVALSTVDTDVLKTYVKLGLGLGIMAKMAYDIEKDSDLELIRADHLSEPSLTHIALRLGTYLRGYIRGYTYDFINMFAPHLTREKIDGFLYLPIEEDFSI